MYEEREFINHMDQCSKLKLQRHRQKLERDISELDQEHRKSTSNLKKKISRETSNPLIELCSNTSTDFRGKISSTQNKTKK